MKIGIVTQYYKSCNYGGLLQSYALSTFLKKTGNECEQVCFDYYRKTKTNQRSLGEVIRERGLIPFGGMVLNRLLFNRLKSAFLHVNHKISIRQGACKYFRESVISHSDKVYDNETIKDCQNYDVIITGSDQVWLCNVNNFHPGFWLSFADDRVKKVSYAASISMKEIPFELHDFVKKALSSFCAISVREKIDVKIIKDIIGEEKDVSCVLDPTFLLERNEWENLCEKNPFHGERYIFAYLLGSRKEDRAFIKNYAKKHGLKVIFIPYIQNVYRPCDDFFGDVQLFDVSPQLFLSLIHDATLVFTDSFHGSVFSNIFHVNYFVFKRDLDASKLSMNSRLYSLLSMLKMESRMISNDISLHDLEGIPKINFEVVDAIIDEEKKRSINFLKRALEN